MTIDLLPTIASLIGAPLPEKPIDGKNIWPLVVNESDARSPHEAYYFYYNRNELQGMRSGKWKLYFPHRYSSIEGHSGRDDGQPVEYTTKKMELELYDLENDVSEKFNVANQHPTVVDSLQQMADKVRVKLGDALTGVTGADVRPAATLEDAK
jgi:arylsulfatase A-like enzyme